VRSPALHFADGFSEGGKIMGGDRFTLKTTGRQDFDFHPNSKRPTSQKRLANFSIS